MTKNLLKIMHYIAILMLSLNIEGAMSWAAQTDSPQAMVREASKPLPKIYTIYNISMDETAASSRAASQVARLSAQRLALKKLFRKIIGKADYDKLPPFTDGQVTELVSGIEVANEKISDVRYLADFTIHFSREKIYNFLSNLQIPFAETLSRPVSVLAVLEKEGASVLWEENNPWRRAWQDYDTINNLVPLNIIEPSHHNRLAITLWQAQKGDLTALQAFAKENNIRKLYVMNAQLEKNLVAGSYALDLTIFTNEDAQPAYRTRITTENIYKDMPNSLSDEAGDSGELARLYNEAIKEATYWLDNQWKEKVMVRFGVSSHLTMVLKYDRAEDWFEIKKKLQSISLIRKVIYNKITTTESDVVMEHSGDVEQIILTLDQKNLTLTKNPDNYDPLKADLWVLSIKK